MSEGGSKKSNKLSHYQPFILTKPLIIVFGILTFLNYRHFISVGFTDSGTSFDITFPLNLIIFIGIILDLVFIKNKRIFKNIGLVGMILSIGGLFGLLISTFVVFFINLGTATAILRTSGGLYYCIITVAVIMIERFLNLRINGKSEKEKGYLKSTDTLFKVAILLTGSLTSVLLLFYLSNMDSTLYVLTLPVNIAFTVGLLLNLYSVKKSKFSKNLETIGALLFVGGFSFNWIFISYLLTFFEAFISLTQFLGICFGVITSAVMVRERYWNLKKLINDTTLYEKPVVKVEKIKEKVPKSKGFLKKGLKVVSKQMGEIAGDMVGDLVEDKLTEITGNENLAGVVGSITDKSVSNLTEKGLSKLAEKAIRSEKPKGLLKKGLKGIKTKAGKIAGDMVGDAISDITSNEKMGDLAGKFAKKGVSKLLDAGVDAVSDARKIPSSSQVASETIKVDYKKRLLGIIMAKKQVKIEYVKNILKMSDSDIIGMIYELIGKEKIKGSFNEDDTEFTLH